MLQEFDRLVDENKEDVTQYLDLESARRHDDFATS